MHLFNEIWNIQYSSINFRIWVLVEHIFAGYVNDQVFFNFVQHLALLV